ncbi:hypothetical protein M0R45_021635 [Rubus argutus]|uniref:Uncharacterized protein n=1 Tax=Rubus argutus TaxID=59490 RepID=A0AAW1XDP0_RUBAR
MSENSDSGQLLEPSSAEDSNAIQNDVAGPVHEGQGRRTCSKIARTISWWMRSNACVAQLDTTIGEKESFARQIEEEREAFVREVGALRFQLKALTDQQPLLGENGGDFRYGAENGEKTAVVDEGTPWIELINECSGFVKKGLEKQSQIEARVRELDGIVYMKDQEIEGLNANAKLSSEAQLEKDAYFDAVTNRMLASLSGVVGLQEVADDSIGGKFVHVERGTSMLIENFNLMLAEIEYLRQCLPETTLDHSSQEVGGIFAAARNELLELKRKEAEFVERFRSSRRWK